MKALLIDRCGHAQEREGDPLLWRTWQVPYLRRSSGIFPDDDITATCYVLRFPVLWTDWRILREERGPDVPADLCPFPDGPTLWLPEEFTVEEQGDGTRLRLGVHLVHSATGERRSLWADAVQRWGFPRVGEHTGAALLREADALNEGTGIRLADWIDDLFADYRSPAMPPPTRAQAAEAVARLLAVMADDSAVSRLQAREGPCDELAGVDDAQVPVPPPRPDGVAPERWADYNRRFNDLIYGRAG